MRLLDHPPLRDGRAPPVPRSRYLIGNHAEVDHFHRALRLYRGVIFYVATWHDVAGVGAVLVGIGSIAHPLVILVAVVLVAFFLAEAHDYKHDDEVGGG